MNTYWLGLCLLLLTGVGCADIPVSTNKPRLEIVTKQENWHAPSTTITLNYPRLITDDQASAAAAMNQAVELQIRDYVNNFLSQIESNDDLGLPPPEYLNYLEVSVHPRLTNERLVSVIFAADTYLAGLAHPNRRTQSFNFDLEQEKVLSLEELFVSDQPYLEKLASTTVARVKQQLDESDEHVIYEEDWLYGGAGPDERNYHTVSIVPEGLLITFDPYDIAPYANGSTEILLTFAQLGEIVSPRLREMLN